MESNINLELIEKVKSGKAAIEHTGNNEDLYRLINVLSKAFPNCYLTPNGARTYYFYDKTNIKKWISDNHCPKTIEATPLSAFFNNELPKEDLNLIAQIDARLKHYNLIAPIEQVEEVEYVYRLAQSDFGEYKKGIIYKLEDNEFADIWSWTTQATEAEYLSQQEQPKQFESCKNPCDKIGCYCDSNPNNPHNIVKEEVKESIYDVSIYQNPIEPDNYGIQISAEVGRKFTKEFTNKIANQIKALLQTL